MLNSIAHSFDAIVSYTLLFLTAQIWGWINKEDTFLEILQVIILSVILILLVRYLFKMAPKKRLPHYQAMVLFLTFLTTVILGRETSWGSGYHLPDRISDTVEHIGISAIILGTLVYVLYPLRDLRFSISNFIKTTIHLPFFKHMLVFVVLMTLSYLFDKKIITLPHYKIFEEGFEVFGYLYYGVVIYSLCKTPFPQLDNHHKS